MYKGVQAFVLVTILLLAMDGSSSWAQPDLGEITHLCDGRTVGPTAAADAVIHVGQNFDKLLPSIKQCLVPPDGYEIDVASIDFNVWSAENQSVSRFEWGSNQPRCGPPMHCYGVLFDKPSTTRFCYSSFVRGSNDLQHIHVTYTPCVVVIPNSYTISVTVHPTGTGTVTTIPSGIADCKGACASRFPGKTHVVLTAAPNGASNFAGWTGDPECNGKSDNSIEILPKHVLINCYANFK